MDKWLYCSGLRQEEKYKNLDGKLCNKKLLSYDIKEGSLAVKCQRCAAINEIKVNFTLNVTDLKCGSLLDSLNKIEQGYKRLSGYFIGSNYPVGSGIIVDSGWNKDYYSVRVGIRFCHFCDKEVSSIDSHTCINGIRRN